MNILKTYNEVNLKMKMFYVFFLLQVNTTINFIVFYPIDSEYTGYYFPFNSL